MTAYKELPLVSAQGDVVLPAEADKDACVRQIIGKWGCNIIRDSDGTKLSPALLQLGLEVYSTICLVRADQKWPKDHRDKLPQKFLMSEFFTATGQTLELDPMRNYFNQKYEIDTRHDPKRYWQVFDRTSGKELPTDQWNFNMERGVVVIENPTPFHLYTVNFLVYQIWDSTSMYNHITNSWTCDPIVSTEAYHKEARAHLMDFFENWLAEHPDTDVVRLTTLAYHFVLDSDKEGRDKYRDWTGYLDTITIEALEDFYQQYGYRLTSEDFVDEGYYNATYRVPSERYRDWMNFIHRFVIEFGKELVDKIHAAGKKAAIFQGDHWIGVEPYSEDYPRMGIDINIGACENGVALRRLADSPVDEIKEIRLYPYFFSDVFREGGNPLKESLSNWVKIRRAMLRNPVDRIGYGGYLSLAAQFPDFVDHVANLCAEFRSIKQYSQKTRPYSTGIKVGVLSAWGKWRSWFENFGRDQKFLVKRSDVVAVAGSNLLESLSGLAVEVEFISFDEIEKNGVPDHLNVIINDGEHNSAWSGGRYWTCENIVSSLRDWVYHGGGFIGNLEPTAQEHQGRFFQLADVMGVDKEIGSSVMSSARLFETCRNHFITDDNFEEIDLGTTRSHVFPCSEKTRFLKNDALHVLIAAHTFGKGRSVYTAGMPFCFDIARLLERAIFWAAGKETQMKTWFSDNIKTNCAYFPEITKLAVVNNVATAEKTSVFGENGQQAEVKLEPYQMKWFDISCRESSVRDTADN